MKKNEMSGIISIGSSRSIIEFKEKKRAQNIMPSKKPPTLLSREYVFLNCMNFFLTMNFFSLLTITPDYLINHFHQSEAVAGLAASFFLIGILTARFVAGSLVGVVGFKRLQAIATAAFVLSSCGYFFADTPATFFVVRLLTGFTFGLASNTNTTIVTSIIPRERTGEGVGYYMLMQTFSMAIGPFIALNLVAEGGYNYVFALGTILPAIGLILIPFERLKDIAISIKKEAVEAESEKPIKGFDRFFEKQVLPIAAISFIVFIFYSSLMPFLSVYAAEIELSMAARYYYVVNAVVMLVTRPLVSKLFDSKGASVIMFPGIILMAAGYFFLSTAESSGILLLSAGLFGAGVGAVLTANPALVVRVSPRYRLGVANATYFMALDSSAAIGPILGGLIIPLAGFREYFGISFVWIIICIPISWYIYSKIIKRYLV